MTKENLDRWCSYCGCEGGCHKKCLRKLSEKELAKLPNVNFDAIKTGEKN